MSGGAGAWLGAGAATPRVSPVSVGGGALGALCLRSYWEPVPSVIHSEEESPRI